MYYLLHFILNSPVNGYNIVESLLTIIFLIIYKIVMLRLKILNQILITENFKIFSNTFTYFMQFMLKKEQFVEIRL